MKRRIVRKLVAARVARRRGDRRRAARALNQAVDATRAELLRARS